MAFCMSNIPKKQQFDSQIVIGMIVYMFLVHFNIYHSHHSHNVVQPMIIVHPTEWAAIDGFVFVSHR